MNDKTEFVFFESGNINWIKTVNQMLDKDKPDYFKIINIINNNKILIDKINYEKLFFYDDLFSCLHFDDKIKDIDLIKICNYYDKNNDNLLLIYTKNFKKVPFKIF